MQRPEADVVFQKQAQRPVRLEQSEEGRGDEVEKAAQARLHSLVNVTGIIL